MFSVETPKRRFNANAVKFGGVHPYVVRTSQNNGRRGTIVADEKWLNPGKTISFGQDTATIFYQPEPYFTGDKIKVMSFLKGALNESVACYFLAAMRKSFASFSWGTSSFNENVLKEVVVSLPVVDEDSRQLDLAYMESYIRELESARVRELEKWLRASGFNDCSLTSKERKAVDDYCLGNVPTAVFRIGALFDIHPTRAYKLTNAKLFALDGKNPVVTNGSVNNGIGGCSLLPCTEEGNMITFSDTTTSEAIFYQPNAFVGYPHVQGLYSRVIKWTDRQLLYIVSLFRKMAVGLDFDYAHKFTRKIAADMELLLPVVAKGSREIDFTFIDNFVRAVMKLSIRGVVEWKDREIAATKKSFSSPSARMSKMDVPEDGFIDRNAEEYLEAAGLPSSEDGAEYAMPPEETLS